MESERMTLMQPALPKCKVNAEEEKDTDNDEEEPEGRSGRFHTCR